MSRIIVRIETTEESKGALERTCRRFGMTQLTATDRLVKWFHEQPEAVQRAVLDTRRTDAWRLVLEEFARPKPASSPVETSSGRGT